MVQWSFDTIFLIIFFFLLFSHPLPPPPTSYSSLSAPAPAPRRPAPPRASRTSSQPVASAPAPRRPVPHPLPSPMPHLLPPHLLPALHCVSFLEMLLTADEEDEAKEEGQIGCLKAEIAASLSLLVGLLRMVKDRKNPTGILPALRLLRTLSPQEQVRGALIGVGAIAHLVDLLPELPTECLELALHILELLTARGEGIECLKGCARAIPNVVRVIMRVSEGCTGHALEVLRGACDGEPEGVAAAVEAGMAARLLLVMQSGCSAGVKQKAAKLLKLCSMSYCSETRFMSKCKLTRTIQG